MGLLADVEVVEYVQNRGCIPTPSSILGLRLPVETLRDIVASFHCGQTPLCVFEQNSAFYFTYSFVKSLSVHNLP